MGVHGGVVSRLRPLDIREVGVGQRQGNETRGLRFQKNPEDIELVDLICAINPDQSATIGNSFDDTDVLQFNERLPRDMTLDLESLDQVVFNQSFPRMQPAENDILFQPGYHLLQNINLAWRRPPMVFRGGFFFRCSRQLVHASSRMKSVSRRIA